MSVNNQQYYSVSGCFKGFSLLILTMLLLSCSNGMLETVRKVTYPPDFNYISTEKLVGTMHQFAWYSTMLENNFRDNPEVSEEQRQSSIMILKKMEQLSFELGTETLSSNHNIVSYNIDRFREKVREARIGLEQNPPNYYRVGSITAYCINCHALAR